MADEAFTEEFEEGEQPELFTPIAQVAGVWANWARVTYARHEFTIDFVRVDPFEAVGVVVARVSMSTLLVTRLVAALEVVWHDWARTALPPEVS